MPDRREILDKMFARCAYVTLARACEYLAISPRTFRRYCDIGTISTVKSLPKGHYRLDKETILSVERELIQAKVYGEPVVSNPDSKFTPLPLPEPPPKK